MLERFPAPQVVKMDVEGMEYEALKGAAKLLRTKPTIRAKLLTIRRGGQLLLVGRIHAVRGALAENQSGVRRLRRWRWL
jgi:hypothetical protein